MRLEAGPRAQSPSVSKGYAMPLLWGNGRVETEDRFEDEFHAVHVGGSCGLRLSEGDFKVEVACDENLLPFVEARVVGGELRLGLKPNAIVLKRTELEFDVSLPRLSALRVSGSAQVEVGSFSGEDFRLELSGSGELRSDELAFRDFSINSSGSCRIELSLRARQLELKSSGSGDLSLGGSAQDARLSVSGSASIKGRDLYLEAASVESSGSSGIELSVSESLEARISGSGRVRYWGEPQVERRISGSGRVEKAGD